MPTFVTQFDDAAPYRNFDRYLAIDFRINSTINLTHSALADLRADFVTADFLPTDRLIVSQTHLSFSYSFFASIRTDRSASASFHSAKKS